MPGIKDWARATKDAAEKYQVAASNVREFQDAGDDDPASDGYKAAAMLSIFAHDDLASFLTPGDLIAACDFILSRE